MQNWYRSTSIAQRIFMFLITLFVAGYGLNEGSNYGGNRYALLLMLPLILQIYLQLGRSKATP